MAIFIRPGSPLGVISDVAPANYTIWTQGGVKNGHDRIFLVLCNLMKFLYNELKTRDDDEELGGSTRDIAKLYQAAVDMGNGSAHPED